MIKLTDEQIRELRFVYERAMCMSDKFGYRDEFEAVIGAYLQMIAASPTHRIVEAPKGYEFGQELQTNRRLENGEEQPTRINLELLPIPKPCPAPVLEPVKCTDFITVEQVYGGTPRIVTGYNEVVFGRVEDLRADGFKLYICNLEGLTARTEDISGDAYRICLRKWEGK